jgi:hypothetical protein
MKPETVPATPQSVPSSNQQRTMTSEQIAKNPDVDYTR